MNRSWVIKLGTAGRCVPFCEKYGIVGVGWKEIPAKVLRTVSRDELRILVTKAFPKLKTNGERGSAMGNIYRFARECKIGDYVLYYVPGAAHVVICQVESEIMYRDFEMNDDTDIWLYRKVKKIRTIPILDFYGALVGRILGPRMSFWELRPFSDVDAIAKGNSPDGASDPELEKAYTQLRDLVLRRAETLGAGDWEWLVADYFKAQGAHVDERKVGGSRAVVDVEARFDHGELGEELWRVQVKRYQKKEVDWPQIKEWLEKFEGGDDARLCFVSVYGFTAEARSKSEEEGVRLLEAGNFTQFLISGKISERLRRKLKLPILGLSS